MAFLDELLEGGSTYRIKVSDGGASFSPVDDSDDALEAFQDIVGQIEDNEGDGYDIHKKHESSDHGQGLVDLVFIALADEDD